MVGIRRGGDRSTCAQEGASEEVYFAWWVAEMRLELSHERTLLKWWRSARMRCPISMITATCLED